MEAPQVPEKQKEEEQFDDLNAVGGLQKFKPVVKPAELQLHKQYQAETIKTITTGKYGRAHVVESNDFQMFLPKRFQNAEIKQFVKGRTFTITELIKTSYGKPTPALYFEYL